MVDREDQETKSKKQINYPSSGDGCDLHPFCLTCPETKCILDTPGALAAKRRLDRDLEIIKLYKGGKSILELTKAFNASERTIEKVLTEGKVKRQ